MTTETKFTVGDYKTRDGSRARVYATDGVKPFYIHGASLSDRGWLARTWTANGYWSADENPSPSDLMPPLREWWVVRHPQTGVTYDVRSSRDQAISAMNVIAPNSNCEIIHVREVRDDQA